MVLLTGAISKWKMLLKIDKAKVKRQKAVHLWFDLKDINFDPISIQVQELL